MKYLTLFVFTLISTSALADGRLYSNDGKYLGNVNNNPYDANSISNSYGRYGNAYSADSVNNPYGRYGNPYSPNYVPVQRVEQPSYGVTMPTFNNIMDSNE